MSSLTKKKNRQKNNYFMELILFDTFKLLSAEKKTI